MRSPAPAPDDHTRAPARRIVDPSDRLQAAFLATTLVLAAVAIGLFEAAGLQRVQWHTVLPVAALAAAVARPLSMRVLRVLAALAVALLLVVAYTPLAARLHRPLVRADSLGPDPMDAIVVLAAWVDRDGHLNAPALDRLLTGAELYRRGAAPRLVLSRVRNRGLTSDADQQRVLSLLGVPVNLTVVDSVHATRDEAVRAAAIRPPLRRIAVVTSPSHTRRACAAYEKVGFAVTCVPSESRDLPIRSLHSVDDRMKAFGEWVYESLATWMYRRRGWI